MVQNWQHRRNGKQTLVSNTRFRGDFLFLQKKRGFCPFFLHIKQLHLHLILEQKLQIGSLCSWWIQLVVVGVVFIGAARLSLRELSLYNICLIDVGKTPIISVYIKMFQSNTCLQQHFMVQSHKSLVFIDILSVEHNPLG